MNIRRYAVVATTAVFLAGCQAPATHQQITEFNRVERQPRILLLPVDVELAELQAGGLLEPKAEWTNAAQGHIATVLRKEHETRGNQLVDFVETEGDVDRDAYHQIVKLHAVVGRTALIHHNFPVLQLPSKNGRFDWSLGPSIEVLKRKQEADYALFIYVRDSYSSAGRAAMIFVGALLGLGIQGGAQTGFASLVDLKTGEIVWFNRVLRPTGDLRTAEAAQETIQTLLVGLPK